MYAPSACRTYPAAQVIRVHPYIPGRDFAAGIFFPEYLHAGVVQRHCFQNPEEFSVLAEYEKAKDVTRKRMMYEAFEDILSKPGMEKLVLPSDAGSHVLPLLPLDAWKRQYGAKEESR